MTNQEGDRGQVASAIPDFASREEMAAFWDSHDVADYQDQFETVQARVTMPLSEGLMIRLDSATLEELGRRAKEQGVGPTALARLWILDRLNEQQRAS